MISGIILDVVWQSYTGDSHAYPLLSTMKDAGSFPISKERVWLNSAKKVLLSWAQWCP